MFAVSGERSLYAVFGDKTEFSLVSQIIGIVSVYGFAFIFSLIVFGIIKAVMGVRVDAEEEEAGLDIAEHGSPAYTEWPQLNLSSQNFHKTGEPEGVRPFSFAAGATSGTKGA